MPLEGDADLSAEGLERLAIERTSRTTLRVQSVSWASSYSMNARLAGRYRIGQAFLIGEAAHIHPPTGSEGLNTSLQDVHNIGWKLAAVLAGAPACSTHTRKRAGQWTKACSAYRGDAGDGRPYRRRGQLKASPGGDTENRGVLGCGYSRPYSREEDWPRLIENKQEHHARKLNLRPSLCSERHSVRDVCSAPYCSARLSPSSGKIRRPGRTLYEGCRRSAFSKDVVQPIKLDLMLYTRPIH